MKLFNQVKILFIWLLGVVFSSSVLAETKQARVYTKFSDQEMVNILKAKYPETSIIEQGKIRVIANGTKHIIYNIRDNGSLTFRVYFSDTSMSLSDVNKWNRDHRFMMVYLDEDNYTILQSDLDTEKGISKEYLLDFVERFAIGTMLFAASQKN